MKRATTASSSALLLLLILLALSTVVVVDANARFVMTSPDPKCVSVEVPSETIVRIRYEAPDSDVRKGVDRKDGVVVRPSFITVMERPVETLEERRLEKATDAASLEKRRAILNNLSQRDRNGIKPVSHAVTERVGSFSYESHASDCVLQICVRDKDVSENSPKSFHLRVEEQDEENENLDAFEKEERDLKNRIPLKSAEHHWTFLEAQLDRIEHEIHTILREADFFRERDALYHQQADDLNKATVFWPMLHVCILLVTGFTQANHIISFFKQHRII
mmetsp:Transcript_7434/g.18226  ORF Transcript_7434/g.18226 Transcript_7434/m.18226 type:complete len:277 (+) Transcript_7434:258-1088(+)